MISDEILNVLDNLAQKYGIVVDWTSEKVIPYLQNLFDRCISYDIFNNIFTISILLILTIIFGILSYIWLKKWDKEGDKDWPDTNETILYLLVLFLIIFIILIIADAIAIPFNIVYIVKDIYVPELRMLDLLQGTA